MSLSICTKLPAQFNVGALLAAPRFLSGNSGAASGAPTIDVNHPIKHTRNIARRRLGTDLLKFYHRKKPRPQNAALDCYAILLINNFINRIRVAATSEYVTGGRVAHAAISILAISQCHRNYRATTDNAIADVGITTTAHTAR